MDVGDVTRVNYIQARLRETEPERREAFGAEYDAKRADWLATLPRHKQMGAYLVAQQLPGEADEGGRWVKGWDPATHGPAAEVTAHVAAWADEQATLRAEAERQAALVTEETRKKAEDDLRRAEEARAERERVAAQLQADQQLVDSALREAMEEGRQLTPLDLAMMRIASAGAKVAATSERLAG